MSDFVKYVVKLLGKGCPLWASVLSLLRESTLGTAGHVSMHANPSRTEGRSST